MIHVLYHANCNDGFCCAWLLKNDSRYADARFVPMNYGEPIPSGIVARDTVLMVDFSMSNDDIRKLLAYCCNVFIIDHHVSAIERIVGDPELNACKCVFDKTKSGARLVCDWLLGVAAKQRHWLVDYTEDRDLWKWQLWKSAEVNAALSSYDHDFSVWDGIAARASGELEREGEAILRYQQREVRSRVEKANTGNQISAPSGLKLDVSYALINCTSLFSEVAGEMCEKYGVDVGICWFQRKDGKIQLSIRSRAAEGSSRNALAIAKALGGGGHPNAAGCELSGFVFADAFQGLEYVA
jgi:oligoribonuclease NrnB/cAMP/cGMP phosphodiesterase (DHH superfamily)